MLLQINTSWKKKDLRVLKTFFKEIVDYVASEKDFLDAPYCINCGIDSFCAFSKSDMALNMEGGYGKKILDIGEGINIFGPVAVGKGLGKDGKCSNASLSHHGASATFSC